jgi:hypothetical protein
MRIVESDDEFSATDFRWAETKQGEDRADQSDNKAEVYINHKAFEASGVSPEYIDKMMLAESLHNLKTVDPERYKRLKDAALSSPEYIDWMNQSYSMAIYDPDQKEDRGLSEWHDKSRFDQIIGGYLFAEDKDIPTMKNWRRDDLPWGKGFESELKKLANSLGMK